VLERNDSDTVLRNFRGEKFRYPEPAETDCSVPYDEVYYPRRSDSIANPSPFTVLRRNPG